MFVQIVFIFCGSEQLAVSSSSSASRHLVRCQVLEPRELRGGVQLAAHQETSAVRRGQGPAKIFIHLLEKYLNLSHCIYILDIGRWSCCFLVAGKELAPAEMRGGSDGE